MSFHGDVLIIFEAKFYQKLLASIMQFSDGTVGRCRGWLYEFSYFSFEVKGIPESFMLSTGDIDR